MIHRNFLQISLQVNSQYGNEASILSNYKTVTNNTETDFIPFRVTNIACDICREEFPNSSILVHLRQKHSKAPDLKALLEKYRKITRQLRDAKIQRDTCAECLRAGCDATVSVLQEDV